MLLSVCFGLALVGTAFGAEPTKCCFDKQYSVIMGDVGEILIGSGPANYIAGHVVLGFDYYRNLQGFIYVSKKSDGSTFKTYVLKDYTNRRVYTRVNNDTCTYSTIPSFDVIRPPCIPDNATYMGPSVLGYGAHNLKLYNWMYDYRMSADETTQIVLSVTQEHCVPAVESMIGTYLGTPLEQSLFYVNYHPGLKNVNSLYVPTGCVPATASPSG